MRSLHDFASSYVFKCSAEEIVRLKENMDRESTLLFLLIVLLEKKQALEIEVVISPEI
jgi:hypothetical protein